MVARALNIRLLGGEIFGAMGTRGEALAGSLDDVMSALLHSGPFIVVLDPESLVEALPVGTDQPSAAELEAQSTPGSGPFYEATVEGLGEAVASVLAGSLRYDDAQFIAKVAMGVLARHAGCAVEDDNDFPVLA